MIKKKLCKLITTGLIVTMFMGSVGTTVSAAEADTASTEIIMLTEDEESGREDSRALEVMQEREQDPPAASSEAETALIVAALNVSRAGSIKNIKGICQRNQIPVLGCITLIDASKY